MEQKPNETNKFKTGSKQRIIKKLLGIREFKKLHSGIKKSSSPSSESKKSENSKDTSDASEKPLSENNEDKPASPSRSSPEPNCAICLEGFQNISFTDSCNHTFCFTCILKWSKVKPECPLCKKQFSSILHNVQKDYSFEEYHIISNSSKHMWTYYGRTEQQRFRLPPTTLSLNPSRRVERNLASYQETYQNQIASHRMRYAPHSVNIYSSTQLSSRTPCTFRQKVYAENLWVRPSVGGRKRMISPEFYKHNPACAHRLIPFLNRELISLWQDNEAHVTFVLELIMSLVARYEITSEEFLCHIEPYMGRYTHHFIHELYNFAISPYEMRNYDINADYGLNDQDGLTSDNDVIAIPNTGSTSAPKPNRQRKQNLTLLKQRKKILKDKNLNSLESIRSLNGGMLNFSNPFWLNPGPSTSGLFDGNSFHRTGTNSTNFPASDMEVSDDDEVQVVDVVKPKSQRTPEVVDLSSDDDAPAAVINVSSDDESLKSVPSPYSPKYFPPPLNYSPATPDSPQNGLDFNPSSPYGARYSPIYSHASSTPDSRQNSLPFHPEPPYRPTYSPTSPVYSDPNRHGSDCSENDSSDDIVCVYYTSINSAPSTSNEVVKVKEDISAENYSKPGEEMEQRDSNNTSATEELDEGYKLGFESPHSSTGYISGEYSQSPSTSKELPKIKLNISLKRSCVVEPAQRDSNNTSATEELDSDVLPEVKKHPKIASAIIKPWSVKNEVASLKEWPSTSSSLKRRISSTYVDGSLSDSFSDIEPHQKRMTGKSKLKLRSVVAHFSYDHSEARPESSHHKKHKKKKKKKKHSHKHYRVVTESDSN